MKNVLVLSSRFPPQGGIGTLRVLKFVKYLDCFGWQSSVLTVAGGTFYYSDMELLQEIPHGINVYRTYIPNIAAFYHKMRKLFSLGNIKKEIHVRQLPSLEFEREMSTWGKIKNWLVDYLFIPDSDITWLPFALLKGVNIIRNEKIDVIFTSAPPFSNFVIGLLLKIVTKKPWVVDYRDLWTDSELFTKRETFVAAIHRAIEQKVIKTADTVITTTQRMTRILESRLPRLNSKKFITIINGFDASDFRQLNQTQNHPNSKCVMAHIGSITPAGASRTFLEAIMRVPEDIQNRLEIIFVGGLYAPDKKLMENLVLKNCIKVRNFVTHSEAIKIMRNSDILVSILGKFRGGFAHMSTKIYEYLATGKPILALAEMNSAVGDLLKETGGGIIVDIDDVEAIEEQIISLFHKFKEGELRQKRNTDLRKYERKELTRQLSETMDTLLKKH